MRLSIGFTGTQRGMTDSQLERVSMLLDQLLPSVVHHGDCIGADKQFHDLVRNKPIAKIVIHPPTKKDKRAFCLSPKAVWRPAQHYLKRNQAIVTASHALIATPKEHSQILRSGTWATIRYARKKGIKIYLVLPEENEV